LAQVNGGSEAAMVVSVRIPEEFDSHVLERSRGVSDTTDMRGLLAALGQDGSALLQRPVLAAKDAEEQEITRGKSDVTEMFGLAEVLLKNQLRSLLDSVGEQTVDEGDDAYGVPRTRLNSWADDAQDAASPQSSPEKAKKGKLAPPEDDYALYRMPNSGIQSLGPRGPADFAPPDRGMPLQMFVQGDQGSLSPGLHPLAGAPPMQMQPMHQQLPMQQVPQHPPQHHPQMQQMQPPQMQHPAQMQQQMQPQVTLHTPMQVVLTAPVPPSAQMVVQPMLAMMPHLTPDTRSPEAPAVPAREEKAEKRTRRRTRRTGGPLHDDVTLMLRNIPNKYTQEQLLEDLEKYKRSITFLYCPSDFRNSCNLGYAFMTFADAASAEQFWAEYHGHQLPRFPLSTKVLVVETARVQGLAANIERFRSSSVLGVLEDESKPMLFEKGERVELPAPRGALPPPGERRRRKKQERAG